MSTEFSQALEEIESLISDEKFDEAQERIDAASETFGKTIELRASQCDIDLANKKFDEVLETTDALLTETEEPSLLAHIHHIRGYAYYFLDQLEKARVEQNAAVRFDPGNYDSLIGRAIIHEELGFPHAALLDLRRAVTLDDKEGEPHAIMASIFMNLGQLEECQKEYEIAAKLDDEDLDSRLELARFYALEQRSNEAIELLSYILSSDKDPEEYPDLFAPTYLLRSQLSLTLGSSDLALEDATHACELIPDLPWGYLQVAATKLYAQNDAEGAVVALKQAEKIAGDIRDLPDLYALYAGAYKMLDKEHKVRKYVEEAEGVAQLPSYVYGALNPVENIPINPERPLDFRRILNDLFGRADKAPKGYEEELRRIVQEIMKDLPRIRQENPEISRIEIQLPPAPGMIGGNRSLLMELRALQTTETESDE